MGNHLATLSSQAELNLPELGPTVLFLERLGGGRFIKSLKCSHENHILVVKVYCKSAAAESVEGYGEELALLLSKLSATHAPNVQPFRWFKETSTAAFIARQYIHSNLLELLSTPPFLTGWEKRWIAFQLLQALVSHRPEMLDGHLTNLAKLMQRFAKGHAFGADWWCVGILTYECLSSSHVTETSMAYKG